MTQSHFAGFKSFPNHSCTGEWKHSRLNMCCTVPDLLVEMEQFAQAEKIISQELNIQQGNGFSYCQYHISNIISMIMNIS